MSKKKENECKEKIITHIGEYDFPTIGDGEFPTGIFGGQSLYCDETWRNVYQLMKNQMKVKEVE